MKTRLKGRQKIEFRLKCACVSAKRIFCSSRSAGMHLLITEQQNTTHPNVIFMRGRPIVSQFPSGTLNTTAESSSLSLRLFGHVITYRDNDKYSNCEEKKRERLCRTVSSFRDVINFTFYSYSLLTCRGENYMQLVVIGRKTKRFTDCL